MLLPNDIFIQARFDLVGCRDVLNVEHRRCILFLFLFLQFLALGNAVLRKITQIQEADVREAALFGRILHLLAKFRVFKHSAQSKLVHGIHGAFHAVLTDADIALHLRHPAGSALRSAADKAHILILAFLRRILGSFRVLFQYFLIFIIMSV